jgi:16S rRNA (guanine527-N7)-methyltransferase
LNKRDDALRRCLRERGLQDRPDVLALLNNYVDLLMFWNRRINLTGTRDEDGIIRQHVSDALALLAHLPSTSQPLSLVDVGSGGGLPGLIVALVREDIAVTLLEPIHKKHAFLATAARELHLDQVRPLAERLDVHLRRPDFRPYDVAVSRATWPLPEWLARAVALVRAGGLVLGMEGQEEHALPEGASRHPYPLEGSTRAIIRYQPLARPQPVE